ncbi:MAG: hypothetical protein KBC41_03635 [Candidatus Pacebacteria bacterium]|nr:hypothetical protein [Candidatus Paceibacterota bacterium]
MNIDNINEVEDEDIKQLMEDNDIDEETAEKAQELIDEGLDEEEAVMIAEEM